MENKDERPRYKSICPSCGTELWICKSIAMEVLGESRGHGSCNKCDEFLSLQFDEDKQEFKAQLWNEYMKNGKPATINQDFEKAIKEMVEGNGSNT